MNTRHIILSLLFFLPSFVFAGEIFGTIKKDGQPLVAQSVQITQNGKVIATTLTDKNGYFSMTIKEVGKYKLEVVDHAGATFDVFSTNNSTGYTLSLVKAGDVWQLKKQ
ncbi:MAG TPA: hypothetical protein PLV75_04400 [Saprospiraceae bacterium]|jgi:hypothetical protein|nr:hypothetical protein [Saprospiraceae bacterium]HQW25167.1 hypothetical protein [Saprospiraceae bacterium]